jgi:hypothetical protein
MRGIWGNNESEANENPGERDYDDWISALAIALLEPAEVRKRMDGVEDEDKDAQYKNSIHAFLWEYQETRKSDREFVHVMHSFPTLRRMLRKLDERETKEVIETQTGDEDNDGDYQCDSDSTGEEKVYDGLAAASMPPATTREGRKEDAPQADRENGDLKRKSRRGAAPKNRKATSAGCIHRSQRNTSDERSQ